MKTRLEKWLSWVLCLCMLSAFLPILPFAAEGGEAKYEEVEVWKRTDIILKSSRSIAPSVGTANN